MTAGNNGSGTPENDDPFAYLYRSEGGEGAGAGGAAAPQPGVPRTSYNQVRAVGERQYGQSQHAQQPSVPRQAQASTAHYAAPETVPGGRAAARQGGHGGGDGAGLGGRTGGRGGGPMNRNGLLVGAIAVVAAVILGVGAAFLFSDGDESQAAQNPAAPSTPAPEDDKDPGDEGPSADEEEEPTAELPQENAANLTLNGGPVLAKDIPGAKADGGTYVANFNQPGASATWTTDVEKAGQYRFYVSYGVPGKDMNLSLSVNGKPQSRPLNMENFARADKGAWDKGWTQTWALVQVNKGTNTFKISCEQGNACEVNLDQVWVAENG